MNIRLIQISYTYTYIHYIEKTKMDGFKLIKTTFENKKEIVGVHFNGEESYNLFLKEVKNVYSISKLSEVQVYSKDFIVKPNIFVHFVAQYINNLDFVLDIKVVGTIKEDTPEPVVSSSPPAHLPSIKEIAALPEIKELIKLKTLENKHRIRIAKTIISSILTSNPEKMLLREEFLQLAESVVEVFPAEVRETYYVPFTKGHLAKGKLYDAYNNKRARLSSSGLIRRRIKIKPQPTVVTDDSSILSDSDLDESQLEILKSGCADWNLVLDIWRKTHTLRKIEMTYENLETVDYMEKYKVLQHEKNYELFEIDFDILYPASKGIYEWKLYYNKIISKAEKLKDNAVRDILTDIENTWDEDSKLALALLLIPYLLPTSRQRTKCDVQESFISYSKRLVKEEHASLIKDEDDIECSNQGAKRLKLENHPKLQFMGDCVKSINFAYMDFFGRRHIFPNPLQAVEICFRCFLGSNTKYPKQCEHVWLFMQKLIFQINTPDDAIIPSTNTLVNDLMKC